MQQDDQSQSGAARLPRGVDGASLGAQGDVGNQDLRDALEALLNAYVDMANSGDCGFWDPEKEPMVIAARAALARTAGAPSPAPLSPHSDTAQQHPKDAP